MQGCNPSAGDGPKLARGRREPTLSSTFPFLQPWPASDANRLRPYTLPETATMSVRPPWADKKHLLEKPLSSGSTGIRLPCPSPPSMEWRVHAKSMNPCLTGEVRG
jgi:hypothetical protein